MKITIEGDAEELAIFLDKLFFEEESDDEEAVKKEILSELAAAF